MDTFNYFVLLFDNWPLYLMSIVLVFLTYFIVFKKYYISILDPFTYVSFFSAMAITVPVFLFFVDEISNKLFTSLILTQLMYFIGFRLFSPLKITKIERNKNNFLNGSGIRFVKWFFIIIGVTNIFAQLFSYKLVGIPLFAESRLGIYSNNGGINNLLKRLISVSFECYVILTIYFIYYKKKNFSFKVYTFLSIFAIVVFSVLSGSKGAFITFGLAFFIFALYSIRWGDFSLFYKIKKFTLKFGLIAVILAIIVILFSEKTSNPFEFLLLRIAMTGDVYYMAYPNNVIDTIPSGNWFISLFASPLSLIGLIPRSMIPYPMGFSLMEFHNPFVKFKGPNARMNIFSYVYFGIFFSPIYCFIIGAVTSFYRNKLFYLLPSNILGCILYFLFLKAALKLEPDFHSSLAEFLNYLIILPFFIILSYFLSLKHKS
jgi:hypothetical protein